MLACSELTRRTGGAAAALSCVALFTITGCSSASTGTGVAASDGGGITEAIEDPELGATCVPSEN